MEMVRSPSRRAARAWISSCFSNACQTVRRPPAFYSHMLELERDAARDALTPRRALVHHDRANTWNTRPARTRAPELTQLALLPEDVLV